MSKLLLFLLVVGLVAAVWLNREKISGWTGNKINLAGAFAPATPVPPPTPHPAAESRARAVKAYPALAVQGSAFNLKFLQLFNEKKSADFAFLTQPDWPMQLAEQTARELPPPTKASTSVLNERPTVLAGPTVRPSVQLPGLQGSALDQRPASYNKPGGR